MRNWDYRYCWLRDATATLYALMIAGYDEEARSWREWLLRAAAGKPSELQIMYGLAGERRLTELILPWLDGYKGAVPVRIGNAAASQFQLDVYGEVMHVLHQTHRQTRQLKGRAKETSLGTTVDLWNLQRSLVEFLEGAWQLPDEGIWETRGGRQHFTYSKIMAWVAFSRAIRSAESFGEKGMDKLAHWRQVRDEIHRQVCERGYDPELGAFVQSYGSKQLDASLLMVPLVGFLPANDSRVRNTVAAIERHLLHDGFVMRYRSEPVPGNSQGKAGDGLPPGEGVFLMCSFWYADNLMLLGRYRDAWHLFRRLLDVRNDVGLLSEEYDPDSRCLLGNFPQAFSHVALINTAHNLAESCGRSEFRVA